MVKQCLNALFVLLFISINCIAQNNTFEITYDNFEEVEVGYEIYSLGDGTLIISGVNYVPETSAENFCLTKIDTSGNILWSHSLADTYSPFNIFPTSNPTELILGDTSKIFATYSKAVGDSFCVAFAEFSIKGDLLSEKVYTDVKQGSGREIDVADDGSIYITVAGFDGINSLIKLNKKGELLWKKYYPFYNYYDHVNSVSSLSDGSSLFLNNSQLIKYSAEGDSINSMNFNFYPTSINRTNSSILIGGIGGFAKINEELDTIWSKYTAMGRIIDEIIEDENGGYLMIGINTTNTQISKITNDGFLEWQTEIRGLTYSLLQLPSSKIVLAGQRGYNLYIAKTNSEGMVYQIDIDRPIIGEVVTSFKDYSIQWYSPGINLLNIELTIDGGNNWSIIASNIVADSLEYLWSVPAIYSDNCYLKLTSLDYPDIVGITKGPFKIIPYVTYDYIHVNNIKMWVGNNGSGSHDYDSFDPGFYWYENGNTPYPAISYDGLVFGGIYNGELRVNGNTYKNGLIPGSILTNFEPDSSLLPKYSLFKVNRYWEYFPPGRERNKLEYNYNNWPVEAGAPFEDNNNDGVYDPEIDSPYFIGDEVLYYVANDMDTNATISTYGSLPMELEFQTLVWGYSAIPGMEDVVFKKYIIINKSSTTVESMYLTYWADCDLGYGHDDFAGCDSSLDLGYIYNYRNEDYEYGNQPPAVGHMLLQGPKVPGESNDKALFKGKTLSGYKNLPMTSFVVYDGYRVYSGLPYLGEYQGTIGFYHNMQGRKTNGEPFINPNTNSETVFPLSGDPEGMRGWYDGMGTWGDFGTGGREYALSSGPFNLAPGDTQEVVYAIFMARGSNNLNSVTELKNKGEYIRQYYQDILANTQEDNELIINEYKLYQSYPNPFNPTTTIEFNIPAVVGTSPTTVGKRDLSLHTKIIVFDILGREVKTLINKPMQPGRHKVEFDASGLASGVYFYQLKAGDFIQTKKMVLLR